MNKPASTGGMITPSCWLNAATTTQALIPVLLWWRKKNELGQGGIADCNFTWENLGNLPKRNAWENGKCSVFFFMCRIWIWECSALLGWSMVFLLASPLDCFEAFELWWKSMRPPFMLRKKTKKFHDLIPEMAIVVKPVSSFQPVHHFGYPFAKFRGCSSEVFNLENLKAKIAQKWVCHDVTNETLINLRAGKSPFKLIYRDTLLENVFISRPSRHFWVDDSPHGFLLAASSEDDRPLFVCEKTQKTGLFLVFLKVRFWIMIQICIQFMQ